MQVRNLLARIVALLLCVVLAPHAGLAQAVGDQLAGMLGAVDPAATRNGNAANLRDQVQWNDLLETNPSGRLRVNLRDGSILSLGSSSQMRVIQHSPAAQQTTLDLLFGRLRSQVVKLTQPNSKFEVRTPTSVAGVIGTDFLLIVTADRTTVVVFSGIVRVTPRSGAGGSPNDSQSVTVNPGQQVDVTNAGVGPITAVTQQLMRQLMLETTVSHAGMAGAGTVAVQAGSHILRNVLIALGAAAAGTVTGVVVANSNHSSTTPQKPPSGPGIPPQ